MSNKYVLVSLGDAKTKKIADVISNASCKKILDYLSEIKEASESDISNAIKVPLNTVDYNIKKLVQAGLVEKTKNFFWSVKGKKIDMYKVSNKSILITPKSKVASGIKSILPAAVISGLFAILLKYVMSARTFVSKAIPEQIMHTGAEPMAVDFVSPWVYTTYIMPTWVWFLAGAIFALVVFLVINLIRRKLR